MKTWEDFLNAFDEAQPEVRTPWGRKAQDAEHVKYKFRSAERPQEPRKDMQTSKTTLDKINKLQAIIDDKGATAGEKDNARRLLIKLKEGVNK